MDKDEILKALEKMRQFSGFAPIDIVFKELGITDDIKQQHLLDILIDKKFVTKSNYSDWQVQITEVGKRVDNASFDRLFANSESTFIKIDKSTGNIYLKAGDGGINGDGGDFIIKGGDGTKEGKGGDVNITAGNLQQREEPKKKNAIWTTLLLYWWAFVIPVIVGIILLAIENKWF